MGAQDKNFACSSERPAGMICLVRCVFAIVVKWGHIRQIDLKGTDNGGGLEIWSKPGLGLLVCRGVNKYGLEAWPNFGMIDADGLFSSFILYSLGFCSY
jgi:hypothetical protein